MQSVTVLTPNARRHVVKVEPNKTILWVILIFFALSLFEFHNFLDFGTNLYEIQL
jgi:hypothetical protein